jgi:hypothetical protein
MKDAARTATAAAAAPQSGSKEDAISSQHRRRVTKQMKDPVHLVLASMTSINS